jgi:hypothetical protein
MQLHQVDTRSEMTLVVKFIIISALLTTLDPSGFTAWT